MNQVLLALAALVCAAFLSVNVTNVVNDHERGSMRSEIELSAAELSIGVLDRLATLPVTSDAPVASLLVLDNLRALDEANGLVQTVDVQIDTSTVSFDLTIAVEAVRKQGNLFAVTAAPTPFRRATARVQGPLDTEVQFERLYSTGAPLP